MRTRGYFCFSNILIFAAKNLFTLAQVTVFDVKITTIQMEFRIN